MILQLADIWLEHHVVRMHVDLMQVFVQCTISAAALGAPSLGALGPRAWESLNHLALEGPGLSELGTLYRPLRSGGGMSPLARGLWHPE